MSKPSSTGKFRAKNQHMVKAQDFVLELFLIAVFTVSANTSEVRVCGNRFI